MKQRKIITDELKRLMKELEEKGLGYFSIGKVLGLTTSSVKYHLNKDFQRIVRVRSIKNQKPWKGRKKYMKNYMSRRYKEDEEFREKAKACSRNYMNKKYKEDKEFRDYKKKKSEEVYDKIRKNKKRGKKTS